MAEPIAAYLSPYLEAAARHGSAFRSLLWASPSTQRARFAALARAVPMNGQVVLDAGCGRADLLIFLRQSGIIPHEYVGLEAVPALAEAAMAQKLPGSRILLGDFISNPVRLCVGAEVIVFSGSLNTVADDLFYKTIRLAFTASGSAMAFNFLSSAALAGKPYLYWRNVDDVLRFCRQLTENVEVFDDYLQGDCTIALRKPVESNINQYKG